MASKLKVHRFLDCTGYNYHLTLQERRAQLTAQVRKVTCGACKQRILKLLLDGEWEDHIDLPDDIAKCFERWADHIDANRPKMRGE